MPPGYLSTFHFGDLSRRMTTNPTTAATAAMANGVVNTWILLKYATVNDS